LAAKRKKKATIAPWVITAFAVLITVVAVVSLLSDRRLAVAAGDGARDIQAVDLDHDLDQDHDQNHDHDRDQIDQKSRDELRDILRGEAGS
jgi:Ni/Co efflux regulator RcnB